MNLLLLSGSKATGNLPAGVCAGYLDFAETWIKEFFANTQGKPILFVPYARPGGDSEEHYFNVVKARLNKMGIEVLCAPTEGLNEDIMAKVRGIFVGGGHTYTLLNKLQATGSLDIIRTKVKEGLPYLGSSAGSIIACPTIKTTNDMPGSAKNVIDLTSLGLINIQLNCHYMDNAMHDPKHQGETRDTRLKEFCAFNPDTPVLGLYEGTALRVQNGQQVILISNNARGNQLPVFFNEQRLEIDCESKEQILNIEDLGLTTIANRC